MNNYKTTKAIILLLNWLTGDNSRYRVEVDQQNRYSLETDEGVCSILISAIQLLWENLNRSLTEENMKYVAHQQELLLAINPLRHRIHPRAHVSNASEAAHALNASEAAHALNASEVAPASNDSIDHVSNASEAAHVSNASEAAHVSNASIDHVSNASEAAHVSNASEVAPALNASEVAPASNASEALL